MDQELLNVYREQTESTCREYLAEILVKIQEYPESAQSVLLTSAAADFKVILSYTNYITHMHSIGIIPPFNELWYTQMLDEVFQKVLGEFIDVNKEEKTLSVLQETIESLFRKHFSEAYSTIVNYPIAVPNEVKVLLYKESEEECKEILKYSNILKKMEFLSVVCEEQEYTKLVNETANKILREFINLPEEPPITFTKEVYLNNYREELESGFRTHLNEQIEEIIIWPRINQIAKLKEVADVYYERVNYPNTKSKLSLLPFEVDEEEYNKLLNEVAKRIFREVANDLINY